MTVPATSSAFFLRDPMPIFSVGLVLLLGARRALRLPWQALYHPGRSAAVDTSEIMAVALELAGQTEVPPDSGIDVPASHVRKALFGIDADGSDLLIAKQLGYDLLINHHPTGGESQVRFPLVLSKHADLLERAGVPRKAASAAVQALLDDHESAAHARNYDRLPSEARLLRMPLMAIHNPCDEIGRRVMDETLRRGVSKSSNVRGAIKVLNRLPEFRKALTKIVVRMGDEANPLGKWRGHERRLCGREGGVRPRHRHRFLHPH